MREGEVDDLKRNNMEELKNRGDGRGGIVGLVSERKCRGEAEVNCERSRRPGEE